MSDNHHPTMRQLPENDRPRERLLAHGAASLSNIELLAIILGSGTRQESALHLAERILAKFNGLPGLASTSAGDLRKLHGMGDAKITQVLAALELARRLMIQPDQHKPIIETAEDASRYILDMAHLAQEHVRVILLNTSKQVIATPTVYIGTINTTLLRTSEIFREAISHNAAALILAHNHPSGDPTPSPEDVQVTRQLTQAAKLLDLILLDHLIVGSSGWRSLKNLGLL